MERLQIQLIFCFDRNESHGRPLNSFGNRFQLTELAGERPRFGYRRLGVQLARNGHNSQSQKAIPPIP
jgi:hypothetical protein